MSGREKSAQFRAHYLFWPNCFGQNSENLEKLKKIVVSAETAQTKNDVFFEKVFLGMGEKVCFTNYVFEKLCSSENTIYSVVSKTQQLQ